MKKYPVLIPIVLLLAGACKREVVPEIDLAKVIAGKYRVTKVSTQSAQYSGIALPPYVIGIMSIERYGETNNKIGFGQSLIFGGLIGVPAIGDPNIYLPDPQTFILPVTQNKDTIYFTNSLNAFGRYYKGTIIYKSIMSPTWEQTVTAVRQ